MSKNRHLWAYILNLKIEVLAFKLGYDKYEVQHIFKDYYCKCTDIYNRWCMYPDRHFLSILVDMNIIEDNKVNPLWYFIDIEEYLYYFQKAKEPHKYITINADLGITLMEDLESEEVKFYKEYNDIDQYLSPLKTLILDKEYQARCLTVCDYS